MSAPFIAVDWGTSRRRALRIANGRVTARRVDDCGVRTIGSGGFPAEAAALRAELGDLPLLMAGMVGSTIGWALAPYVAAPASLADLHAALHRIDAATLIVPGVSQPDPADVMRGEELLVLGALAAWPLVGEARFCQPGTHCKWVTTHGDRITGLASAMTGELFALLRDHSLLAAELAGAAGDGAAFRDGVRRGAEGGIGAALFSIRSRRLLGQPVDGAAFASGVLIGEDVARHVGGAEEILLLSQGPLADLYAAAFETLGARHRALDSEAALVAGMTRLWEIEHGQ